MSIAILKTDRHPSAPPQPYIKSITSTRPTTVPSDSHTGRVKNLLSCIVCSASNTVRSGETDSGLAVITADMLVVSSGKSFATALVIMSLNPNIPTKRPLSTTNAAFRRSAISSPASWTEVVRETIVAGLPTNKLLSLGEA